jgi:hypothetical protein
MRQRVGEGHEDEAHMPGGGLEQHHAVRERH